MSFLISPTELTPPEDLIVVARAGAYLDWLSALLTNREVMLTIWIMRS
jgi:organic hydroperoxide reductase OsmC/OhrA